MKSTLVLFAHPYLEHSSSNRELINFYERHQHYTFRDLYEDYPDFHIAAFRERKRIFEYERFIFHFPLVWFGIPPLLKLWLNEVLDQDWQKPETENPLDGKEIYILVTTVSKETSFGKEGKYQYTVDQLISELIVSLRAFKADISTIMVVYESESLTKKDIIIQKQKLMEILHDDR